MSNFRLIDRDTGFLMPPSVNEWLPERHLARFVVEVVEGLDLRAMTGSYRGSGEASYHPQLLLGLIIYGYATGVFSSRKLERATYDSVAFRFIAANEHPDHDTIAAFRRRFLPKIEQLFVQVLLLAREMGVLKLGTVALDGTKIHANASRHSALSYGQSAKIEAQLQAEVADLMARAEAADQADIPDGMSIPEELARREARLAKIAKARATIEARAKERHAREQAEHDATMAARAAKTAATGKKPGGRVPQPPVEGPLATDQVNLTDAESRIMPVASGGFEQCYNAQAVVAAGSLLVVAADVVQAPNDKQQLAPMLDKIADVAEELGEVGELLADNGYFSEGNVNACAAAGIDPVIAMGREAHHPTLDERFAAPPPPPQDPTPLEAMGHRLQTPEGKKRYARPFARHRAPPRTGAVRQRRLISRRRAHSTLQTAPKPSQSVILAGHAQSPIISLRQAASLAFRKMHHQRYFRPPATARAGTPRAAVAAPGASRQEFGVVHRDAIPWPSSVRPHLKAVAVSAVLRVEPPTTSSRQSRAFVANWIESPIR